MIAIRFDSNESASFLRAIYEDVMIAFHELKLKVIFVFQQSDSFQGVPIQSAKKPCRFVFYIRFQWKVMQCFVNRHKETQSKHTGMAVNVEVLRISKFPDTVLLVIYVAIISRKFKEI